MKATANSSFKLPMEFGHDCEFVFMQKYDFMYRGDNDVILKDENDCGIIYPLEQFEKDFTVPKKN